jgi:hypothetical protein
MKKKTKYIIIALVLLLTVIIVAVSIRRKKASDAMQGNTEPGSSGGTGAGGTSSTSGNDNFPLIVGSRGERVKSLQKALNVINSKFPAVVSGYPALSVDGVLGTQTYERVLLVVGTSSWSMNGLTQAQHTAIVSRANNLATT